MALQSVFDRLHCLFTKRNPLLIDLAAEFNNRMEPFPRHPLRPFQHGLDVDQVGAIPAPLPYPSATLDRIVCAVGGRIRQQLDGLANLVGELYHAMEKLRPHPTAFRTVIHCDLQQLHGCLF